MTEISTWGTDGHEHEWERLLAPEFKYPDWINWERCKHCGETRKNTIQELPIQEFPG